MARPGSVIWSVLLASALAGSALLSADRESASLPLAEVSGTVEEIQVVQDPGDGSWTEIRVAAEDGPVRLRLAPPEALARSGFALSPGDKVRVRAFVSQEPRDVHNIRNESTGRTVRLRCLHGDPLWETDDETGLRRGGDSRGQQGRWHGGRR